VAKAYGRATRRRPSSELCRILVERVVVRDRKVAAID
jgi:hypothetical protein